MKTLLSFPHHLIDSNETREELTERVIQRHRELHNVSQKIAEEMYITECQQLDGYGQEPFLAKNMTNNEVTLGVSVSGIIVSTNQRHKFYAWHDISNVVNHKRTFNIECTVPEQSIGFTLRDADTGRYVWRLCVLQHTFFKNYEQPLLTQNGNQPLNQQLFQNVMNDRMTDSRDDLVSDLQSNWNVSDNHLAATNTWTMPEIPFNHHSGSTNNLPSRNSFQTSAIDVNMPTAVTVDYANGNVGSNWGVNLANSNVSLINRTQSSSCLDLSNNNLGHERDRLKAMLPQYRAAPDYETAIQNKYRASTSDIKINQSTAVGQTAPHHPVATQMISNSAGSQPDMHRFLSENYVGPSHLSQPYPDVTVNTNNPPIIGYNYSDVAEHGLTQRFKMMRLVTAPPPYPVNRLSSTSTPDLHRALLGYRNSNGGPYNVSGSSPDLVSSRTFVQLPHGAQIVYPAHNLHHSQNMLAHGTYENLNLIEPPKMNGVLPSHMQKIYENDKLLLINYPQDVSKVLLHTAADQFQQNPVGILAQQQKLSQSSSQQQINGSIEPIYENIPLPWPSSSQQQPPQQQPVAKQSLIEQQEQLTIASNSQHQILTKATSNPVVLHQSPVEEYRQSSNSNNPRDTIIKTSLSTTNSIAETASSCPSEIDSRNLSTLLRPNDLMNRSHSTNILDSSHSSSYTMDTNTTQTTDSGLGSSGKEKKKSIWNILGRNKSSDKDKEKQKSATLGREKGKDSGKKNRSLSRDIDSPLKHRWSTGTSKLQPLPTTLSKEKLVSKIKISIFCFNIFLMFLSGIFLF